ncbi:MAG: MFS transporter [Herpetosiphonaceae bacterium]|nr:MFS transporter [Herpetosiphonaceae bacterium]
MRVEKTPVHALSPWRLATIVASRFVLNVVFRVTYPLTQLVVVGLHVGEQAAAWLITVQVLAGLLSPLAGEFGDRYGYRKVMGGGLLLATLGTLLIAFSTGFVGLLVGFAIVGVGTTCYQPSMQAYVSEWTAIERRGRALGVIELSWAMSIILGVPVIVALVQRTGTLALGFGVLTFLLALMLLSLWLLPPDYHLPSTGTYAIPSTRAVLQQPVVLAALGFMWLVFCGGETMFVAQSIWLPQRFGVDTAGVATALFAFGLGELGGSSLATLLTDRIGLRRSPLVGFSLAAGLYLILPWVGNWTLYLVCFGVYALCYEYAIVSGISLISAVDPRARGRVLALSSTAIQTGRAAGSQLGVALLAWSAWGLRLNGLVAASLMLLGVALGIAFVHPREVRARS